MSLFGKIGGFFKKAAPAIGTAIGAVYGGPAGAQLGGALGGAIAGGGKNSGSMPIPPVYTPTIFTGGPQSGFVSALPSVLAGAGRVLASRGGQIASGVGAGLLFDELGNLIGGTRKRRRMNPLNARAARRAIRRIKAVRKITRDIEKSLPKQAARRRAA